MKRYWQIYMHLVWSTRNRSHTIRGPVEKIIHETIRTAARDLDLVPICINSAWNHTHNLISWNPSLSMDVVVHQLKQSVLDVIHENSTTCDGNGYPEILWDDGYAAFSVSPGAVDRVKNYIVHQKELHRTGKTIKY